MAQKFITLKEAQHVCDQIAKKITLGGQVVTIEDHGQTMARIKIPVIKVPRFDCAPVFGKKDQIDVQQVLNAARTFYENWKV